MKHLFTRCKSIAPSATLRMILTPFLITMASASITWSQIDHDESNPPAPASNQPRLLVKERIVDAGIVRQGEKATVTFKLENVGNAPLQITNVQTSCGCTIPRTLSDDEKLIEPGEILELSAAFDSKGRMGKQHKTVTVSSNDPVEPSLHLSVTAEIVTLIEVLVDGRAINTITFGRLSPGDEIPQTVEILPREPGLSLELTSIQLESEQIIYEVLPLSKDTRTGHQLKLTIDSQTAPGHIGAHLTLIGRAGEETGEFRCRIVGEIVGEISFDPKQIRQTGPMVRGSALAGVTIRSENQKPIEILYIDSGPLLDTTVKELQGKTQYLITPVIRESAPSGPFGTHLDIGTDNLNDPVVRVPVFGYVKPTIEASPPRILLRKDGKPRSAVRTVKLESATRGRFDVLSVTSDSPYVTAKEIEAPNRPTIGVKYIQIEATEQAPAGRHELTVAVRAVTRDESEVNIPVLLIVPQS